MSNRKKKYRNLVISIVLDLIGISTYSIPIFGELFDLIWAPLSALIMWMMYRKTYGAIAGVFSFFEEILPGMDAIPSFTIMWYVKNNFVGKEIMPRDVTAQ